MTPENYRYHFAYTGEDGRLFKYIKSQVGSNDIANVGWTAPLMIAGSFFLLPKIGHVAMCKLFFANIACTWMFQSIFNPQTKSNIRVWPHWPMKFDAHCDYSTYFMGGDQLAGGLAYSILLYYRLWYLALPIMAYDLGYYGP